MAVGELIMMASPSGKSTRQFQLPCTTAVANAACKEREREEREKKREKERRQAGAKNKN